MSIQLQSKFKLFCTNYNCTIYINNNRFIYKGKIFDKTLSYIFCNHSDNHIFSGFKIKKKINDK